MKKDRGLYLASDGWHERLVETESIKPGPVEGQVAQATAMPTISNTTDKRQLYTIDAMYEEKRQFVEIPRSGTDWVLE